jgi:hypothetical protein
LISKTRKYVSRLKNIQFANGYKLNGFPITWF